MFCIDITITIAVIFDKVYAVLLIKNLFTQFSYPQNSLLFNFGPTTLFTWQLVMKTLQSYLKTLGNTETT